MSTDDAQYTTFLDMADAFPPHVAVAMMQRLGVPAPTVEAIVEKHDAETQKILTLEEPPAAYGRENAQAWYTGPQPKDHNWPAFKVSLKKKLPAAAVDVIDQSSDKVVAMLDHPATLKFRSRGLVIGHVQSGKTSNFTAVIGKAADRGYRMFIVLSGIHNALRSQTQNRLIKDLVDLNPTLWHQITKPEHDFVPPANAASLLSSKDQKLLLVVKKNGPVLKKLKKWLKGAQEHLGNCPTLIIDDEADQATVATKVINPLIADIIEALPRSCYLGYTATPFANLLIDPGSEKDFYPKDFILSLHRGIDYQGPEELFGREPLDGEDPATLPGGKDLIREVPDGEVELLRPAKGQINDFVPEVTPTFRRAVLWFWLATAARKARGQADVHSSMLVHAHSNTKVHDSFKEPLRTLQKGIATALSAGDAALRDELRELWNKEATKVAPSPGTPTVSVDEVLSLLPAVVDETKIVMDHYRSNDRLDYSNGPVTVIAVGGNTLSRGLTLEGLVVSFFVRSADVYDTLLQMGRWFGYRPGYEDLPRIYLPRELRRWFAHLATVEAELRREIDRLLVEHKTPLELAPRIRCHPQMRITAPSKMGKNVKAAAAYGGRLVETRYFQTRPEAEALERMGVNAGAVGALLSAATAAGTDQGEMAPAGRRLWRDVPVDGVRAFIRTYRFTAQSTDLVANLMEQYIDRRNKVGDLHTWNVAVVGNDPDAAEHRIKLVDGLEVGTVTRSRLGPTKGDPVADIKTLTGSRDSSIDLVVPPGTKTSRSALNRLRRDQLPRTGLVLLYPIDPQSEPVDPKTEENIDGRAPLKAPGEAPDDVVWGVAFVFPDPSVGEDSVVEYNYVQADLSRVFPASTEDEDAEADVVSFLNEDQDTEAPAA
ncbi:Z1 domain-containing protein [Geodermatophilus normandii]|uniref:Z1 domain-containing protein n=2 Tax=Geodermatophilus normandii TaxID=1137989 RepID=A0A6P0GC45_9ACTN|nr:Z1 domain-containing protein [Geodermatophilus normandii]